MDAFSPTPTPIGQRLLLALAADRDWSVKLADISTAFLHAPMDADEEVYVMPPPRYRKPNVVW
eukprot:6970457-Heterocapsa_arctica.AAC.1